MKHDVALKVAESLVEHLRPACIRIEIAGSIRRCKPEVKDIEIICIPDLTPVKRAPLEFGKPVPPLYKTALDKLVDKMRQEDAIWLEANGERYKKLYLKYAGIKCDLFINIPPSQWGVQMVIRTGDAEFSHWVVSNKRIGGALPDGYFVKHQVVWWASGMHKYEVPENPDKAIPLLASVSHMPMPEEIDFLNFLELGWLEPRERMARWR